MLTSFTLLLLLAGSPPARAAECPSTAALAAQLERLGTARAVAAVGTPEIQVSGARMRVGLRGLDGVLSGVREVVAPASCAERASVAAILVSAWVGAWPVEAFPEAALNESGANQPGLGLQGASTESQEAARAPQPPSRPAVTRKKTTPPSTLSPPSASSPSTSAAPEGSMTDSQPTQNTDRDFPPDAQPPAQAALAYAPLTKSSALRLSGELGGFGFGLYDGDALGVGAGLQAGLRFARWLGIEAVFSGSNQRERSLVRGTAAYRLFSLGVGLNAQKAWRTTFVDLGIMPEATLLTVRGKDLQAGGSVTRWGLAAAARARFGLVTGSWRPFVLVGVSTALRAERLVLDDYPEQSTTLSRWNLSCGLGVAHVL
jgi:hypothetical protein